MLAHSEKQKKSIRILLDSEPSNKGESLIIQCVLICSSQKFILCFFPGLEVQWQQADPNTDGGTSRPGVAPESSATGQSHW